MTGGSHLHSVARISSRRSHQLRRLSSLSTAPSATTSSSMNHALEGLSLSSLSSSSSSVSSSSSSMMMWMDPTTFGNRNFQEPRPSAFLEQYMKDSNTILAEVMMTNTNNTEEEMYDYRTRSDNDDVDDGEDYYSTSSFEASLNRYLELERESSSYSSSSSSTSSRKDNILFEAVVRDFFKV